MNIKDFTAPHRTAVYLTADLGKLTDYTAISIVNEYETYAVPPSARPFVPSLRARPTGEIWYEIPYLQRLPLNTDYVEQVRIIRRIYTELKEKCGPVPLLVLDATGVGEPVCDLFQGQGLMPVRIWFSGGNQVTSRPNGFNVPKGEIIGALQRAIGRQELKIAAGIPEAATLIEEATRMEAVQNPSGHIRYSHRDGEHDDLVLSVGIGLWLAYWRRKNRLRTFSAEWLGL